MDKVTPKKFKTELSQNIDIICRKVNSGHYHFTRYKQMLFTKGPKKPPRIVCVPTLRDKLTLAGLNEILSEVYGDCCKTQMPQVIIDEISKSVSQYHYFLKLDVKSFYTSINQQILLKKLQRKIRKTEIIDLIKKAIKTNSIAYPIKDKTPISDNKEGIPEGLSISNALANIYLMDLDAKYTENKSIKYWRYVDDILIFVNGPDFQNIKTL